MTPRDTPPAAHRVLGAALCGIAMLLGACHEAPSADQPKSAGNQEAVPGAKAADTKSDSDGVTLSQAQIAKLGIVTAPAKAADYTAETSGYGVVVPHDAIAAAVAELTTAELTAKQTRAALVRAQSLNGTPGALSAEVEETASRQSAADSAAQVLAAQRLSSVIGLNPAWKATDNSYLLKELAGGKIKLLRATFPLGMVHGPTPKALRAAHLDAIQSTSSQATPGAKLTTVWDAPADISVPGRSFFALLKDSDFAEGERLLVWAPGAGAAQAEVLVPAAAVIINNGKFWCYVEQQPGRYRRVEVNTERPVDGGYVVTGSLQVGANVVMSAAGLLLAQESNPDSDAD